MTLQLKTYDSSTVKNLLLIYFLPFFFMLALATIVTVDRTLLVRVIRARISELS